MSLWSTITGTTDQAEQDANLAHQKELYNAALQRRIDAGTISDQQAQADKEYVDTLGNDSVDLAAWQGFQEGAKEGLNNVLNAPGNLVDGVGQGASQVLGGILKGIPWWVWLGLAGYGLIYFGGLKLLKAKLKL
jgi:hypothetical protein